MELSQLSVRILPTLITRLKVRAKEESLSVNSLVASMIETGLNDGGVSAEYGRLKAEPTVALANIHRKLCDLWGNGNTSPLSEAEIKFLADGTREHMDNIPLAGSYYNNIHQLAISPKTITGEDDYRSLLAFCIRHYIADMNERMQFAKTQCPDNITSSNLHIKVGDLVFTINVTGTEFNRFASTDERRPPLFSMQCKGNNFEATLDWDVFTALVRLLDVFKKGEASESRSGAAARLIRNGGTQDEWWLLLGKLQLRVGRKTLDALASEIGELVSGTWSATFAQLIILYGEG
ncbi:hypothetical protein [Dickeya sp. NCPPB 3274]|uniref:hypothetical protein n=1 Tax=Dickeya sp. NCPPB 3274 TaxID=568766 RepID=UPI0005B4B359|nr:hypothetical protein [Dickeya sp. NCPPB 3274]